MKQEIIGPSYYLRKHGTGEWLLVVHSLYLGSHPWFLSLPNCTIGSQAVSLWSSLRWWSGTGRNKWRGCTPPLILWLIAHSPLNKLLTGYQLAASPCQACSIFHSQIVEAATVGAVVSWKLMPEASTKWRLIVCDLSRGWPSEHTQSWWWLWSMPNTWASNSFQICEYFLSASMGALLANVTGWPSCISTKPSPSLDTSP